MQKIEKPVLYLSFDVEADGPAPGLNSMLSFGLVLLDINKKFHYEYEVKLSRLDNAFENLDTMEFWKRNPEAYLYSTTDPQDPKQIFENLSSTIMDLKKTYTIVPIAWPASYDWQWFNYYFWKFTSSNPLGFSCKCIGSYLWGMSKNVNHHVDDILCKKYEELNYPHTHKPLDDAKCQGILFINALNDNIKKIEK